MENGDVAMTPEKSYRARERAAWHRDKGDREHDKNRNKEVDARAVEITE